MAIAAIVIIEPKVVMLIYMIDPSREIRLLGTDLGTSDDDSFISYVIVDNEVHSSIELRTLS
jgi:hypothetical protein